jgi:hypothetical protein
MIRDDGWNYFTTPTKLLDVSAYIIYWIYFGLRMGIDDYQLPLDFNPRALSDDHDDKKHNVRSYMVLLNVIVLLCSFFKV